MAVVACASRQSWPIPLRSLAPACLASALSPLWAQSGWLVETPHFRVVVADGTGIGPEVADTASATLEGVRLAFASNGVGPPVRSDGPLDVLVVPSRLELHAMLRDPPSSRTRGITVRGMDRDYVVVPWHARPGPRVTLAHEYAHQFDRPSWPIWFREGRAVYLAREIAYERGRDERLALLEALSDGQWLDWPSVMAARRGDPVASLQLFQAQAWLLVHWICRNRPDWSTPDPAEAFALLEAQGPAGLTELMRAHLAKLRQGGLSELTQIPDSGGPPIVSEAQAWEIPVLEAEVHRELRRFDTAGPILRDAARRFPGQPRPQVALGTFLLMTGDLAGAEKAFKAALKLGETRARSAYRYAVLMMRPGANPPARAARALEAALQAVRAGPREPTHWLALAHARMLHEDWGGAFRELLELTALPLWRGRAEREAEEVRRRRAQSIRAVPAPLIRRATLPDVRIQLPDAPPPWRRPAPAKAASAGARRIWPPHGTWLVHGRIAWVDCSGGERTVIVHSPFKRYRLAENPGSPPQLINRPFRAKLIPCNTRGYSVAIAYKKLPATAEHDGELVGIRF